jgi:DNA helicase II / ATP-dependent DNA helicase PcrA
VAFKPRPKQREVLAYRSGKMGVSAVPGSGKTQTLSYLAAEIISSGVLDDDQEVLVVTLVNSAVDNFRVRIGLMIEEKGLFPNLGFRVRTLHGLAHDIVRERPGLVGLESNFQIVDERAADQIREQAAGAWLRAHPFDLDEYLDPEMEEGKRDWVRREHLPELVKGIANAYIRQAKDLQITPDLLQEKLSGLPVPLPLAEMGAAIYTDYQRALAYRGAVDFDDLIRLALLALRSDHDYLERLRLRWPYILEDEAQDSSRLQEEILKLLAGDGNWVRVGDPNQAIYETFTTASPQFLKDFIDRPDVLKRQLPNSGRSSRSIIQLANRLIEWTIKEHPLAHARQALSTPYIKPTPRGDPQPNPPDQHNAIQLLLNKFTPQEELAAVANSLARWLPEHPDQTAAVLVPRNTRGFELVNELKRRDIDTSKSWPAPAPPAPPPERWAMSSTISPTPNRLKNWPRCTRSGAGLTGTMIRPGSAQGRSPPCCVNAHAWKISSGRAPNEIGWTSRVWPEKTRLPTIACWSFAASSSAGWARLCYRWIRPC